MYNTNNNPRVIAGYFLETVEKHSGSACVIRGDFGTETVLVRDIQRRFKRDDEQNRAYIEGASTQNQRIESWWGYLRRQHMQHWIDLLKSMQDNYEFSGSDLDKSLYQFCFMALIQEELHLAVTIWNNHTIRRSRNSTMPCGQPNNIFNFPELWHTRNYMWPVLHGDIDASRDEVEFCSTVCCGPELFELFIDIMAEDDSLLP